MELPREQLSAVDTADSVPDHSGLGHSDLHVFDAIRLLLVENNLSPEPPTYELLYLYLTEMDPGLAVEIRRAQLEGGLTDELIRRLRSLYLGNIAASEVIKLVSEARKLASHLGAEIVHGRKELSVFERTIEEQDAILAKEQTQEMLLNVIQNLRRANSRMLTANRRLRAEIQNADIENSRFLEQLGVAERRGRIDPLTGLLNRRGLLDTLANMLAMENGRQLTVALLDIDKFREVNDRWGIAVGDEVLRCIAQHFSDYLDYGKAHEGALIGRYGGEEFLIVLPGTSLAETAALVDKMRAALAKQILRRRSDGAALGRLTFSAGIAVSRIDDSEFSLINRAAASLHLAQYSGGDRIIPERSRR